MPSAHSSPLHAQASHDLEQALQALRTIPWLKRIQEVTLQKLAKAARLEQNPSGSQVGYRGRECSHFMLVVQGTVLVGFNTADGRRHVVNLLGPGQFQSLIPLIDEGPQIHDSHCKGDVRLLFIPRDVIVQALQEDQRFSWEILKLFSYRSRRLYEALGESHTLSLAPRLARILRGLFAEHGRTLSIDQEEIADILGATRQSINRELKALEAQGVIALGRGRISLILAQPLEELCGTF